MTDSTAPTIHAAPESTRAARRIAFATQYRPQVDSNGRPTGPPAQFNYDPETGLLVTVTTPRAEPNDPA